MEVVYRSSISDYNEILMHLGLLPLSVSEISEDRLDTDHEHQPPRGLFKGRKAVSMIEDSIKPKHLFSSPVLS